jgi:hypothetical protein
VVLGAFGCGIGLIGAGCLPLFFLPGLLGRFLTFAEEVTKQAVSVTPSDIGPGE